MTWLFTQVWLWSLAAFVLGSLINWSLFVRPLRRRLRAVTEEYADFRAAVEHPVVEVRDEEPQAEATAWELLPTSNAVAEAPAPGDEQPRRTGEPGADAVGTQRMEQPGEPEPDPVEVDPATGQVPVDDIELRLEEVRELAKRHPERQPVEVAGPPTAPAEPSFTPPERPERPEQSGQAQPAGRDQESSWFQNAAGDPQEPFAWAAAFDPPEVEESDFSPSENRKLDPEQTGHLRSLFEPRNLAAERERAAAAAEAEDEDAPLPRRTPGVGPLPGRQNLNRLRQGASVGGEAGTGGPGEQAQPEQVQPESGAQQRETVPAAAAAEESTSSRDGKMIKGHFASRQYHTPESPQYDRIVAEVWFRSAADAEQAGFEPWDGEQSLN